MLHPGLKLQYFKNNGWEDEWVEMAEMLTRSKYEQVYEKKAPTDSASENVSTASALTLSHTNLDFSRS